MRHATKGTEAMAGTGTTGREIRARLKRIPAVLGLLLLIPAGCGVSFVNQPLNVPLPSELSTRAYFQQVGAYQRNLPGLLGHVLYAKKVNGSCETDKFGEVNLGLQQYLKAGIQLSPNNEAVLRYESKIDKGMSAKASLFAFSSGFSGEQRAEVSVSDAVTIFIKDDDIPKDQLIALANKEMPADVCARYYIRGATLSIILYKAYTHIDANAQTSGNAFGAEGKVYGQGNALSLDFKLGINIIPLRARPEGGALAASAAPSDVNKLDGLKVPAAGFPVIQEQ